MPSLPPDFLPVSSIRRCRIQIETATGLYTSRVVAVEREAGEPEAVTRQKAVNAFRRQFGYADRIVSIVVNGD
jgi:hypothetical protein